MISDTLASGMQTASEPHAAAAAVALRSNSTHRQSLAVACTPNMVYRWTVLSLVAFFTLSLMHVDFADGETIQNRNVYFTGIKSDSGLFCATSSPNKTLTVRSKLQCTLQCQQLNQQPNCCVGVNYRQQSNQCDVFFKMPTSYVKNSTGCQYIQVRRINFAESNAKKIFGFLTRKIQFKGYLVGYIY